MEALSAIDSVAARSPLAVGEKVTWIWQLAPGVTVPQGLATLFAALKSPALAPLTANVPTTRLAVPVLVTVTGTELA